MAIKKIDKTRKLHRLKAFAVLRKSDKKLGFAVYTDSTAIHTGEKKARHIIAQTWPEQDIKECRFIPCTITYRL